ncbi:hypothetical protein SUGI_1013090 [Cryptomeria japonica]|nr:hypothetical protein SUGI_1013090 [Cryptomeria japonica]
MWFRWLGLEDFIESWWKECSNIQGTRIFTFCKRLQFMKDRIKTWNREVLAMEGARDILVSILGHRIWDYMEDPNHNGSPEVNWNGLEFLDENRRKILKEELSNQYILKGQMEAPRRGRLKLNLDDTSRTEFMIRDDTGAIIRGGSIKLPIGTNTEADFAVLSHGLATYKEKGLTNLDVERDSQVVIRAISSRSGPSWRDNMWTESIKEILENLEDYSLSHVYREAMELEDWYQLTR